MTTIDLVYFDAGGGHRAAAVALQAFVRERHPEWSVRLVHLFDVLDPTQRFKRMTGLAPEDYYNKRLARGWTIGLSQELKVLQAAIRLGHAVLVDSLQAHWTRTRPDLVVSLIPNFNRALYQSVRLALPRVPYVTVMTDLADLPPHFWIEPGQDQDIVCGTPRAVEQAIEADYPRQRVHRVSGMLLRPDFHRRDDADRSKSMAELGLDPALPTGLVMFGGQGSRTMLALAGALEDTQLILMCGHNAKLAQALQSRPAKRRHAVVDFTPDVPRYMRLADFFIGKPGPGSLSEAVQMRLPVIVADNAWTMPQERYNAEWIRDNGIGIVLRNFKDIRSEVKRLIGSLTTYKAATARLENRAGAEVVTVLENILARELALAGGAAEEAA